MVGIQAIASLPRHLCGTAVEKDILSATMTVKVDQNYWIRVVGHVTQVLDQSLHVMYDRVVDTTRTLPLTVQVIAGDAGS